MEHGHSQPLSPDACPVAGCLEPWSQMLHPSCVGAVLSLWAGAMPLVLPLSSVAGLAENSLKLILTSAVLYFFRSWGRVVGRTGQGHVRAWGVQGCAHTGACTDTDTRERHPRYDNRGSVPVISAQNQTVD